MEAEKIIILICTTLLLSYLSSLIYAKTKVPDLLWLMGFGLIMGPLSHVFDKELFLELAPMMSIIALSIILFEAGINMDINMLLDYMGKAMLLSITSLLTVTIGVGLILTWLMPSDFTLIQAMLLGAMVGGTSTVSTYSILSRLQGSVENLGPTKVLLTLESIVSDPLCIIASITLIEMVMLPNVSLMDSVRDIFGTFVLSSSFGLGIGLLWARVLDRLRKKPFTYMITISTLLIVYIISEEWIGEGGGAMTALVFGLAITNYPFVMSKLGRDSKVMVDKHRLREFHEEITFFIKSFFFVYIGLVVSLSLRYTFIGLGVAFLLMVIRFTVVSALGRLIPFSVEERTISRFVFAMGLPAFVMSQLPMIFDPLGKFFVNPGIYPDLCMPIVLGTVVYGAVVAPMAIRRGLGLQSRGEEKQESSEEMHKLDSAKPL